MACTRMKGYPRADRMRQLRRGRGGRMVRGKVRRVRGKG